jgi:hypothetical protein
VSAFTPYQRISPLWRGDDLLHVWWHAEVRATAAAQIALRHQLRYYRRVVEPELRRDGIIDTLVQRGVTRGASGPRRRTLEEVDEFDGLVVTRTPVGELWFTP